MKISIKSSKQIIVLAAACFALINNSYAQNKGILPLTGLKYYNEGVSAKLMDVKIDGARLISNRIPLNREIEISLIQPAGFNTDNSKTMFAGAEVIVLSPTGEVLMNNPNVLLKSYSNGFSAKDMNTFGIKFGIGSELIKGNFSGLLKVRLYDLKGKNQMKIEFPVTFARAGEPLQVSKTAKAIKSNDGVNGIISGLQARDMVVKIDTTIKVAPKMAYTSMDITNIEGSSLSGIFQGKENFWVYDSELNEVKITDILLKQVKGAMENNTVNYTLKIPYKPKTNTAKNYIVRFRWESPDKRQVIDVVVTI